MGKKNILLILITIIIGILPALAQNFSGKIVYNNSALENVQVLVFDYSTSLQEIFTNSTGDFEIKLEKNHEYIICFSKIGFNAYVVSLNLQVDLFKKIIFTKDPTSPNGLLSNLIQDRIQYAFVEKNQNTTLFDYSKISSITKADSIRVIFNKLQVYQYRYIADFYYEEEKDNIKKLSASELENERNKTLAELVITDANIKKSKELIATYSVEEKRNVEDSKNRTGSLQLKKIVSAQEFLYKRIYENGQLHLYQKNESVLLYQLKMIEYYSLLKNENESTDFETKIYYKKNRLNAQSSAYNYLYIANNNFEKYENHLSLFQKAYQEYIELLKYSNGIQDTSILTKTFVKTQPNIEAPIHIPLINNSDSLASMEDNTRKILIQKAVEEEDRFSNFTSTNSTRMEGGEEIQVNTIKIANDIYEKISTKKGIIKYIKNNKPISATTFKFETTRRYKNLLEPIK